MWRIVHLGVLEGVSSETLLILLPAYIFMREGGGGWERSTMEEEGLAWVSYYWINYSLVFIGCVARVSFLFLSPSRTAEAKTKRKREREILRRDTTGNSRGLSKYTVLTTLCATRSIDRARSVLARLIKSLKDVVIFIFSYIPCLLQNDLSSLYKFSFSSDLILHLNASWL